MKYKNQLAELGVSEAELTPKIKKSISTLQEYQKMIAEMDKRLVDEDYDDEDEKDEIETAKEELIESLADLDKDISEKIKAFVKGKTSRSAQAQAAPPKAPASVNVTPAPVQTPPPAGGGKDGEKKKSGNGLFLGILGAAVLIVTLGSVNVFGDD